MARVSKIKYNPSLSVAENARLNNCTVDAIRYYIRTRGIDRRYEGKMNIIEDIRKYLQVHPSAKKAEVARETKHGINQVKKYWNVASGKGELKPTIRTAKREKRAKANRDRLKNFLDSYSVEIISEYLKERKAEIKQKEKADRQEEERRQATIELKNRIDALIIKEHENSQRLMLNPSYLSKITKADIYDKTKAQYDMEKYQCVAFRSKGDLWKTYNVDLGNMNGGYSYMMNGVMFPSSEHAYIFGLFSNNTEEHKAIQEELLAEPSGYNAKRGIRRKYNGLGRVDWNTFNVEWMLYVVWQKALNNSEFRDILMALPQGVHIIEDVSFKPQDDRGADFWGARNPKKKEFGRLTKKYVQALEFKTKKAEDEAENKLLWDYCNVGTYEGYNVMGKILTLIKQCLHDQTEPEIDYDLLKSKNIHMFDKCIFA